MSEQREHTVRRPHPVVRWYQKNWVTFARLLQAFAIVAAGVWAIIAYYAHMHDERVQNVLEYSGELRREPLFTAWTNTMLGARDTNASVRAASAGGPSWINFSRVNGEAHYGDIIAIAHLYDDLANCVRANLCDQKTAQAMFGYDALFLYDNYAAFIACRKRREQHFADGLIAFMSDQVKTRYNRPARTFVATSGQCPLDQ